MAVQRPSAARRVPVFRGRASERDRLARLLDQVRSGESAALVVRGEEGIGKTALLDQCAGMASGLQVARIAGMQSEMELPFAGLHQLCAPVLGRAEALHEPQRNALQVAFGLTSGDAPDRFLIGLATLSLLAEVAQKRPLLCLVDDAQWLDAASGQVLGFVARRLLAESVLMLFAVREPTDDHHLAGLAELRLSGLADDDARALLVTTTLGRVDARVRDRIVAETRGNPLALLELPRGMSAAEVAGGFAGPRSGGLSGQLEEHFLRRFDALPEATRRLVLVAAADPTGDVALLRRAVRALGIANDAATDADGEQVVEIGERVRFRHPLVRSAIYSGASAEERRAVHRALAGAMDPEVDPDRRAWHLALATAGPTRRWRPSSNGQPAEPCHAVAWLRPLRSFSAQSPQLKMRSAELIGPWQPPKPTSKPERSTRRSDCWPRRRPMHRTSCSAPGPMCCAGRSHWPPVQFPRPPPSSSRLPSAWSR